MMEPPRFSRWLLGMRLPREDREFVLGDLAEEYAERASRNRRDADRWYRRQLRRSFALSPAAGRGPGRAGRGLESGTGARGRRAKARAVSGEALSDFHSGARSLAGSPTVSAVAALTLALGIGLTTATFTLVDAILVKPLRFPDADRLVTLRHHSLEGRPGEWNSSFLGYLDYQARSSSFQELAAWQDQNPSLGADDGGLALRVRATGVTWNLFSALGVEPEIGRGFSPEEDAVGAGSPVALLSYGLWQARFGGDPAVLGRSIRLDSRVFTIIGVMPRSFTGAVGGNVLPAGPTDVWMPYRNSSAADGMEERGLRIVTVIGRLAEGVTLEQAQADVSAIAAGLAEQYPEVYSGEGAILRPAHEAVVGWVRPILLPLFGAAGLVLVIACANVVNLLLGRTATRRREVAVRMALGAGRARIARQMTAESLLLGAAGGLVAGAIAWTLVATSRSLGGVSLPRLEEVAIGGRAYAFAAAVSVVAGLALGIIPTLQATRGTLQVSLRSNERTGDRAGAWLRQSLVVAQIALAVVLLVGAGLLIRSFERAISVDPGFDADSVLTAHIRLPMAFVDTTAWPSSVAFFTTAIERLATLPGVEAATAAYQLPTEGGWSNAFTFADRPPPAAGDDPFAVFRPVQPGYFEVMGIELLRGRTFTDADQAEAPRVVIVNQAFVNEFFDAGVDPLGTRLAYGNWWAGGPPEYEIVGVVADVRFGGRTQDVPRATYFPHAQQPVREMSLIARTSLPPMDLVPLLREAVAAIDPELPVDNISTLEAHLANDETIRLGVALMSGLFAACALLLAAIGVYGVMSFSVAQRTRELGIRMALGARAATVRRMVLTRGVTLAVVGAAIGLAGAAAVTRYLQGMLFQVSPGDPGNLAAVIGFLTAVALLACWLPARRATRVDPMISLRAE